MKSFAIVAAAAIGLAAGTAQAAVTYLNFEGIAPYPNASDVLIGGYYNGGTSSIGTSGPNVGVEFTSQAILLCLNTAGTVCSNTSRGGLGIATSDKGALFFPTANPTMNVAAGFDTGFSFVYSDPLAVGSSVSIYDGLNGTGSLLASAVLPGTTRGGCDAAIAGSAQYCPFNPYSLSFSGVAKSVVFGGPSNRQVFDDFTFGSTTVGGTVPEPQSWSLLVVGFGLVGTVVRRRRTTVAA